MTGWGRGGWVRPRKAAAASSLVLVLAAVAAPVTPAGANHRPHLRSAYSATKFRCPLAAADVSNITGRQVTRTPPAPAGGACAFSGARGGLTVAFSLGPGDIARYRK